jgi:hypothetical protein
MRGTHPHLSWASLSAMVTAGASCSYCGSRDHLVAHHKVPRRLGGLDLLENLEPVCRGCHPRIERAAFAEAELDWASPAPEGGREPRRPHRLPRLY